MDSGNSGSLQSSSGEDEFDSQTDGISALLMNNNQAADHVVAHFNRQQPPEISSSFSYMYHNPLSNYFDLVSPPQLPPPPPPPPQSQPHRNNTLLINSDVDWLKTLRSETEITTFQSLLGSQNQVVDENTSTTDAGAILVSPPPPQPMKNPRKRSRASRRAPTTVMTTDTSNFRAMVQEFTGIPAYTSSSAPNFLRNRGFDLFGGRASQSQPSSYLSKPFPQKFHLGSSSSIIASSNFNVPNPIVSSFHEPNFNVPNPIVSTKTHQKSLNISPNDSRTKMGGGFDEYSCHVNTNTHSGRPNLIYSADQTTMRIRNNNQEGFSWQNNGVDSSQDNHQSNFNFSS